MKRVILSPQAPASLGLYSQAVAANGLIFCSGQLGIDPKTGKLQEDGVEEEARQALRNLKAILEEAGLSLDKVVKVTIYLIYMPDLEQVNKVYKEFFSDQFPSRSAVGVAQLPLGARIEIDLIATIE